MKITYRGRLVFATVDGKGYSSREIRANAVEQIREALGSRRKGPGIPALALRLARRIWCEDGNGKITMSAPCFVVTWR